MKILLSILLLVFSINFAMENTYQMPDEQTLNGRLFDIAFDHFAAKTGLVYKIANKEVFPCSVKILIESGFMEYKDNLKKGGMPEKMVEQLMYLKLASKQNLYQAIFQDHPQALKELEELNNKIQSR